MSNQKSIHYKDIQEQKEIPSLIDFAAKIEEMRDAQKEYFRLSAKSKRSKLPEDYAASKEVLQQSKDLEKEVDQMVNRIKEGGNNG